jgi:exopolysaccharide biosynthesis WecB/TagA/CpsF family protein
MTKISSPICRIGDTQIHCTTRQELLDLCIEDIEHGVIRPKLVMDVNGHGLSLARRDLRYREIIEQADILHADGGFLIPISKYLCEHTIPERSATTDMIHDFALGFEGTGKSFYLLGATEEVNQQCEEKLLELYPELNIVGRRNGYFNLSDEKDIIAEINRIKPDVIWLGLGKPKEQEVALRWRDRLEGTAWIVTCGGCFNYITGHYSRAPMWMQRTHLEWVYRLVTNPRQLFVRYLTSSPHALWIALTDSS